MSLRERRIQVARLPRLVGSRSSAAQILAPLQPVAGDRIVLDCRDLLSGSPSFADEIVKLALQEGEAAELIISAAGPDFEGYIRKSAAARELEDKVTLQEPGGVHTL